jgi:DNA-binding MltR family transcriptional regulator
MIKYLNHGEIKYLRTGYYVTLLLKLISKFDFQKFMNLNESFERAIRIYKLLVCLNDTNLYRNYSSTMLKYILKFGVIEDKLYEDITQIISDDTSVNIDEDDTEDDALDYEISEDRESLLINVIRTMADKYDINAEFELTSTIYAGDNLNYSLFGDIQRNLRSDSPTIDYENMDYDELVEEYLCSCEVDSMVVGIENYEFPEHVLGIIKKLIFDTASMYWDNGYSDIYIDNGNTYIFISYSIIESLSLTLLNMIILAFPKN